MGTVSVNLHSFPRVAGRRPRVIAARHLNHRRHRLTLLLCAAGVLCPGWLGCAAFSPASRTDQPAASQPVAQTGQGNVGGAGGDTGIGLHYESVLPWGVACLVIMLAAMDKALMWWDRFWSNKRSMARIGRGQED